MLEKSDFSDYRHKASSQAKAERIVREEEEKRIDKWIENEKYKLQKLKDYE